MNGTIEPDFSDMRYFVINEAVQDQPGDNVDLGISFTVR